MTRCGKSESFHWHRCPLLSFLSRKHLENTMWLAGHGALLEKPMGENWGVHPLWAVPGMSPRAGKWQRAGFGFPRAGRGLLWCLLVSSLSLFPEKSATRRSGTWRGCPATKESCCSRLGRLAPACGKGMGTHPNRAPCGFSYPCLLPPPIRSEAQVPSQYFDYNSGVGGENAPKQKSVNLNVT